MRSDRRVLDWPAESSAAAPEAPEDLRRELRTLVTVSRTHKTDFGQRQVFVRLDAGPQIALRFGESFTEEVGPGTHRLRVHNTLFWKTIDFSVEPGEHLEFVVINRGAFWTYPMAGWLGAAPLFLAVHRRSLQ